MREERLDSVLILNERHLHRVLKEYVEYFNHARPHQGIDQQIPAGDQRGGDGQIHRRDGLGGIIHDESREAAEPVLNRWTGFSHTTGTEVAQAAPRTTVVREMLRRSAKERAMDDRQLRDELQHGRSDDLRRRRSIIALSVLGMASMSVVSLYQSGLLKRLPDLPLSTFDSEAVTGSPAAYWWGAAEGTWAVLGCALNLPLATFGGVNRAAERPLIPLLAAAKGVADAGIAAWYVYRMRTQHRQWCSYCLVAAGVDVAVFGLTLPEARKAVVALWSNELNAW